MRTKSSCLEASTSIVLDLVTRKIFRNSVHDFHPQIQMNKKKIQLFILLGIDLSCKIVAEEHPLF